jgi:hypothetical protein
MKYLVNIDTANKLSGDPFNCTVLLTQKHRRVRAVSLKNAQIPLGFYNVRAPYNTVTINGTGYTMSPGVYTGAAFLNALNSTVTNAVGVFSIAASTGLMTFVAPSTSNITTSPPGSLPTLGNLLGFSNGVTGTTITANNAYITNFDTYLNIWIQNFGTSSQETTQCTFKVPLSSGPGTIVQWSEYSQNPAYMTVTDSSNMVDRLVIQVLDRFGQPMVNNGLDWSMTLEIECDT